MAWRMAPAWPERPEPSTVATTSNWVARSVTTSGWAIIMRSTGTREVDLLVAVVDRDLAGARLDPDAGDGVLALAGGVGAAAAVDLGSRTMATSSAMTGAPVSSRRESKPEEVGVSVTIRRSGRSWCSFQRRPRARGSARHGRVGAGEDAQVRHLLAG
jgi:hypothetical protein